MILIFVIIPGIILGKIGLSMYGFWGAVIGGAIGGGIGGAIGSLPIWQKELHLRHNVKVSVRKMDKK